jgi:hypothetical protein
MKWRVPVSRVCWENGYVEVEADNAGEALAIAKAGNWNSGIGVTWDEYLDRDNDVEIDAETTEEIEDFNKEAV